MSKNESRTERLKQNNESSNSSNGISKVYYWIIGILFVVLIILIIFIFSRSGDNVNLGDEQDQSSLVEEKNGLEEGVEEEPEQDTTSETEAPVDEEEGSDKTEETEDTNPEEETDSETDEESTTVNEDAPYDPNYAVDYNTGSADRIEIKNRVMEATGLGDDLIEDWVGNNGPGRVVANVSSRDRSESYDVYLQYGDGSWHVTSVE